jgi:uracil-DNA glycosylase
MEHNSEVRVPDIGEKWQGLIGTEFKKPYFAELKKFLQTEKAKGNRIYPTGKNIFRAFQLTPPDEAKVVILGQDPYHGEGQAHGLCFSVQTGTPPPPSLLNIFKEIETDTGHKPQSSGDLSAWAVQGVFLLNSVLTVRAGEAASHRDKGWEQFTDEVIHQLSSSRKGLVFLLWGSYAMAKKKLIPSQQHHLILEAPHPSPLSAYRGFMGCRHFSKTNTFLQQQGQKEIIW